MNRRDEDIRRSALLFEALGAEAGIGIYLALLQLTVVRGGELNETTRL